MTKVITRMNNLTELAIISTQILYRISLTLSSKNMKFFFFSCPQQISPAETRYLYSNTVVRNAPPGPAKLPCCPGNAKITQKKG